MSEETEKMAGNGDNKKSRALYYGGSTSRAMYYGGNSPAYSSSSYGGSYYYGGNAGQGGGTGGEEEESLMGNVSITRLFRVCLQRWVTILVFLLIGFVGAFAVYKISPIIYEASCLIEMRMRRASYTGLQSAVVDTDIGANMNEVFNTRLARLKSKEVVDLIMQQYRSDFPSSPVTDEEIIKALVSDTELELQRMSRLIQIRVRSTDAQLATDLANAYSKVVVSFTSDQNKSESELAVSWLSSMTEQQKRVLEQVDKQILEYSSLSMIDTSKREVELSQTALASVSAEVLRLESEISTATELSKTLEAIQSDPDKFGSLPANVPRTEEITATYQLLQKAITEKNALLVRYTANHPGVKVKEKEVELYKKQFAEVIYRSLETSKANLDLLRRQLAQLTPKRDELTKKLADLEQKIITSTMKLEQLQRDREVASLSYQTLLKRKAEAELAADENTAIIKPVEPAFKPKKPVLPNPLLIFSAGLFLGVLFGVFFVLMLDHLEDKIIGVGDIEHRLHLKVLAIVPHIRRQKREQIAVQVMQNKFSQYAESIAGLRNLLDSPRYHEMSKVVLCMSTQPGEGKTVTNCSLAESYAQSGQKTLLVDFDLRRPRLARIFKKHRGEYHSLSHSLMHEDNSFFPKIPVPSGYENLDLALTRVESDSNPAMLMGSTRIVEFFQWARENYDHVVVDCPPFGIVGDVMTLSSLVDSVLIMCCPDRTRFQPILHAARSLMEAGARVLGVVVNDVDFGRRSTFSTGGYSYHYAYRYHNRYGGYTYGYGSRQKDQEAQAEEAWEAEAAAAKQATEQAVASSEPTEGKKEDQSAQEKHATRSRQDRAEGSFSDDE